MRSGWQALAIAALLVDESQVTEVFDPSALDPDNLPDGGDIGRVCAKAREDSDVILAHMEDSNPSGYLMAAEMGEGMAHGKAVVYVYGGEDKYRARLVQFSDHGFTDLAAACKYCTGVK